jgi:hypothetical protein
MTTAWCRPTASSSPPPRRPTRRRAAPILIRIDSKAGHGAGKPTTKQIEEVADRWGFLSRALQMDGGARRSGVAGNDAPRALLLALLLAALLAGVLPPGRCAAGAGGRQIADVTRGLQPQPGFIDVWRDTDKGRVLLGRRAGTTFLLVSSAVCAGLQRRGTGPRPERRDAHGAL